MSSFTIQKVLSSRYDDVLARLPEVLKSEGFGVLTEIDVQATMKAKLGVDFRRYKILGACNPPLAHQALTIDLQVGAMLPCNVVVWENDEGKTVVAAIDPMKTFAAQGGPPALHEVAAEVEVRSCREEDGRHLVGATIRQIDPQARMRLMEWCYVVCNHEQLRGLRPAAPRRSRDAIVVPLPTQVAEPAAA